MHSVFEEKEEKKKAKTFWLFFGFLAHLVRLRAVGRGECAERVCRIVKGGSNRTSSI
jgi:hypothetical protein